MLSLNTTNNMHKIYKYPLSEIKGTATLPVGSNILDIEYQEGNLSLWALVDARINETEEVKLEIYGTGWNIKKPDQLKHLKTLHNRGLVWHVFSRNK